MHALDLGKLDARVQDLPLDIRFGQVPSRVGADVDQSVPLVHAEFAHAHFHVQPVVVVLAHVALCEMVAQHFHVDILAPLDLVDQPSTSFGKGAQGVAEEILPPLVLSIVGARRATTGADTDEDANLATRPLVHGGLVQDLRGGVISAGALIDEDVLADLNRFEGESGGCGGATSLPDRAVEFGRRFSPGVIGPQEYGRAASRAAFVQRRDRTIPTV